MVCCYTFVWKTFISFLSFSSRQSLPSTHLDIAIQTRHVSASSISKIFHVVHGSTFLSTDHPVEENFGYVWRPTVHEAKSKRKETVDPLRDEAAITLMIVLFLSAVFVSLSFFVLLLHSRTRYRFSIQERFNCHNRFVDKTIVGLRSPNKLPPLFDFSYSRSRRRSTRLLIFIDPRRSFDALTGLPLVRSFSC